MKTSLFFFLLFLPVSFVHGQTFGLDVDVNDPPEGVLSDEWAEMFINGDKVGYTHTSLERIGDVVVSIEETFMKIGRSPSVIETMTVTTTRESVDGTPLSMASITQEGDRTKTQEIRFSGTGAEATINDGVRSWTKNVDLEPGFFLSWGFVRALEEAKLSPGDSWTCRIYAPDVVLDQALPATTTFIKEGTEEVDGNTVKVSQFEQVLQIGFLPLRVTAWVLEDGSLLRMKMPLGGMEISMKGSTEKAAKEQFSPPDLFTDTLISLNRAIPEDAEKTTFTVRLNPEVSVNIPDTAYQSAKEIGEGVFEVTVKRGHLGAGGQPDAEVDGIYLQPTPLVDFEDPAILGLLGGSNLDGLDFNERIRTLVKIADEAIEVKSMDFGFATASETAALQEGDCTEHALLLAALGRAAGIPTRGATGVVFFQDEAGAPVMGYHMWNQAWNGAEWVDVDAAFGTVEPAPIRILFGTSDLSDPTMAEEVLTFARFLGQTRIDVVRVE